MPVSRFLVSLLLASLPLLGACKERRAASTLRETPTPRSEGTPPSVAFAFPGLSAEERLDLYRLSEGSEILPLSFMQALDSVTWEGDAPKLSGRPFTEHLERYGLIGDPSPSAANPHGLPIGFAVSQPDDVKVDFVSVSCAACHTAEIQYRGHALVVDGGGGKFDSLSFFVDVSTAIKLTVADPRAIRRFLRRYVTFKASQIGGALTRSPLSAETISASLASGAAPSFERLVFDFADRCLTLEASMTDADWLAAVAGANEGSDRLSAIDPLLPMLKRAMNAASAVSPFGDGLIASRFRAARNMLTGGHYSNPAARKIFGFGRVDAFGLARELIWGHLGTPAPINAPVKIPPLWGLRERRWLQYSGATESVLERNIGQALGLGALVERGSARSTVNLRNIDRLEKLAYKIEAPSWPAFLPPIDEEKAERGRQLFLSSCAACHNRGHRQGQLVEPVEVPLAKVGTDGNYLANFNAPLLLPAAETSALMRDALRLGATLVDGDGEDVGEGKSRIAFATAVGVTMNRLKQDYFQRHDVSPAEQALWENRDVRPSTEWPWRQPPSYVAPSLVGAWASAPYLHNGAVATIYDLLSAPADRPSSFPIGHFEYDPERLGFTTPKTEAWQSYDYSPQHARDARTPVERHHEFRAESTSVGASLQSVLGNGNFGHDFGFVTLPSGALRRMTRDEKLSVIEYIKTLDSLDRLPE